MTVGEVAKKMGVTVGTLTIAMNSLVKKGYVNRSRSSTDRRVVLISLSEKGEKAYLYQTGFHEKLRSFLQTELPVEQCTQLVQALSQAEAKFSEHSKLCR